jgi:hypothetical protein
MGACYKLAFGGRLRFIGVTCSSTMLVREKPLFTGCVEVEYGEIPLNGFLTGSLLT